MHDFYAELASLRACSANGSLPDGLASGMVDSCTVSFYVAEIDRLSARMKKSKRKGKKANQRKNAARECYMRQVAQETEAVAQKTLELPHALRLESWPPKLLGSDWLAVEVDFELLTPWYSRDDRVFHLLDNPVRKDRVFGVPFMAASSWKGMLRWACRGKPFREWEDPAWILHLFGNVKGEEEEFHRGALVFYPTWFDRIGFAVINPHSRERRAGTQPIYYEVVPPGTKGALRLLYAPWPGIQPPADPKEFMPRLLQAIEALLTEYGISAKRTVGWGTATITRWKAFRRGKTPVEAGSRDELCKQIQSWLRGGNTT